MRNFWLSLTIVYDEFILYIQLGTVHQNGFFLLLFFTDILIENNDIAFDICQAAMSSSQLKKKTCIIVGSDPNKPCTCDANDRVWRYEEGIINVKEIFPITNFIIGDTDGRYEVSFLTLGPLTCKGKFTFFFMILY